MAQLFKEKKYWFSNPRKTVRYKRTASVRFRTHTKLPYT